MGSIPHSAVSHRLIVADKKKAPQPAAGSAARGLLLGLASNGFEGERAGIKGRYPDAPLS
jgi:hypothetical protein